MNENEKLLGNLITAVQKGLQSGKLNIDDMQYIRERLDAVSYDYISSHSQQLSKGYHESLNKHVENERQQLNRELKHMKDKISELQTTIFEIETNTKDLKVTKWIPFGVTAIAVFFAMLSLPLVFMALGTMWASLYQGLISVIGNNWFFYLLFAVLGVITMMIFFIIFIWLYSGFNWIYERYFSK